MALVRPDTFVAWFGNIDDVAGLETFWSGTFAPKGSA